MSVFLWGVPAEPGSLHLLCRFLILAIMEKTKTVSPSISLSSHKFAGCLIGATLGLQTLLTPNVAEKRICIHYIAIYQNHKDYFSTSPLIPHTHSSHHKYWECLEDGDLFFLPFFPHLMFFRSSYKAAYFGHVACCDCFNALWSSFCLHSCSPIVMSALLWGAAVIHDLFTHLSLCRAEFIQLFGLTSIFIMEPRNWCQSI